MRKIGRWSLMSHISIPLVLFDMNGREVKMLSINVADVLDILVGLLIVGKSERSKLISMNSFVSEWESEFKRFRLKSPIWIISLFSEDNIERTSESFWLKSLGEDPGFLYMVPITKLVLVLDESLSISSQSISHSFEIRLISCRTLYLQLSFMNMETPPPFCSGLVINSCVKPDNL